MKLTSKNFKALQKVDEQQYSGYGKGIFPQLSWTGVPKKALSLALIMHDKDAPGPQGFFHMQAVNIDPTLKGLEANMIKLPSGVFLTNDLSLKDYTPPMPPQGHGPHEYSFYLYALPFATIEECFKVTGFKYTSKTSPNLISAVINFTKIDEAKLSFIVEKTA